MFENPNKFGELLGFLIAYVVFTTVLFFILNLLNKTSNYFHVSAATSIITFAGLLLQRWLK